MEDIVSEIYVNNAKHSNYSDDIKSIFGDDIGVYSKSYILGDDSGSSDNNRFYIYIVLVYLFVLF